MCFVGVIGQEEVASSSRSGLGFGQIGAVGMNVESHLTGAESYFGIGVGCCIVEEACDGVHGGLGSRRLR